MGIPGGTIVTEVWAKSERGIWSTLKTEAPGFTRYFARWRFPVVSLWKRLGSSRQNLFVQEKRLWKIFLTETSLIGNPLTFSENVLSEESFKGIMDFSPAMIPTELVRGFLKTTTLSSLDIYQIKKECGDLWRTDGGSVRDPHQLLEEVIIGMNLHEQFGVVTWKSLDDIPIKTYTVMRIVLECYNEAQSLNAKEQSVRHHARQMAGVKPPIFGMR
jgi:hypothetical protein